MEGLRAVDSKQCTVACALVVVCPDARSKGACIR